MKPLPMQGSLLSSEAGMHVHIYDSNMARQGLVCWGVRLCQAAEGSGDGSDMKPLSLQGSLLSSEAGIYLCTCMTQA